MTKSGHEPPQDSGNALGSPGRALREQAEAIARKIATRSNETLEALSPEETRVTLHNLRVHQIELELQNEELRRTQVELVATQARYFDLYEMAPVGYCTVGENKLLLQANLTLANLLGTPRGSLVNQPLSRFILKEDQDIYYLHHKQILESGEPQAFELRMVKHGDAPFWSHLTVRTAQEADGAPELRIAVINISARKHAEELTQESNALLTSQKAELQETLDRVKRLEGLITICISCKKIRAKNYAWQKLEKYLVEHSDAVFSHGLCLDCLDKEMKKLD